MVCTVPPKDSQHCLHVHNIIIDLPISWLWYSFYSDSYIKQESYKWSLICASDAPYMTLCPNSFFVVTTLANNNWGYMIVHILGIYYLLFIIYSSRVLSGVWPTQPIVLNVCTVEGIMQTVHTLASDSSLFMGIRWSAVDPWICIDRLPISHWHHHA